MRGWAFAGSSSSRVSLARLSLRYTTAEFLDLPVKVIWYEPQTQGADQAQVAYQACGRPCSVLEASAARGFVGVSTPVLDDLLQDINYRGRKLNRQDKILTLLDTFKSGWAWDDIDIARSILKSRKQRQRESIRQDKVGADAENEWDDLEPILKALKCTGTEAVANPAASADLGRGEDSAEQTLAAFIVQDVRDRRRRRDSKGHQYWKMRLV